MIVRDDDLMTPAMRACRRALIAALGWALVIFGVILAVDAVRDDITGAAGFAAVAVAAWIGGAMVTAVDVLSHLDRQDRHTNVELREIVSKVRRLDESTDAA